MYLKKQALRGNVIYFYFPQIAVLALNSNCILFLFDIMTEIKSIGMHDRYKVTFHYINSDQDDSLSVQGIYDAYRNKEYKI